MYTVYKTVCLANQKFYIGVHKTDDPNDDYLGSGKLIRAAVKKYGRESFRKEVLLVTDDGNAAYRREAELVTRELVESDQCYNMKLGGEGGFDYLNSHPDAEIHRRKGRAKTGLITAAKVASDPVLQEKFRTNALIASSKRSKEAVLAGSQSWVGRTHSEETKAKMREAAKNRKNKMGM